MTDDEYTAWLNRFSARAQTRWKHHLLPLCEAHAAVIRARKAGDEEQLEAALRARSILRTRLDVARRTAQ